MAVGDDQYDVLNRQEMNALRTSPKLIKVLTERAWNGTTQLNHETMASLLAHMPKDDPDCAFFDEEDHACLTIQRIPLPEFGMLYSRMVGKPRILVVLQQQYETLLRKRYASTIRRAKHMLTAQMSVFIVWHITPLMASCFDEADASSEIRHIWAAVLNTDTIIRGPYTSQFESVVLDSSACYDFIIADDTQRGY